MEYGISLNSVVPLRAEPDDRSEMISQLLLGECFVCNDRQQNFYQISNCADNYSGWIDEKAITPISEQEYETLKNQEAYYVSVPLAEAFDLLDKCVIRIPGGSRLPNCDSIGHFSLHERKFQVHRDFIRHESELSKDGLMMTAMSFMNAPYLWGGKTVMGMDCSGFTQVVFSLHGYELPRDSKDQSLLGESVSLEMAQVGDLVFCQNSMGNVAHVGILMDKQRVIHASGRIRIEKIDNEGIFSNEYQRYTHKLHSIKRIVW